MPDDSTEYSHEQDQNDSWRDAIAEIKRRVEWRIISTAPKDRPIWVYYDHGSDPYYTEDDKRLTIYGSWAEGGSHKLGKGQCCAIWGGGFECDESGEGLGPWTHMPDWWFEEGSDFEIALAPTHWREKPADPTHEPLHPAHEELFKPRG